MHPSTTQPIDLSTSRVYRDYAIELSNQYERGDRSAIQQRLLQLFPANGRVLDVGCGSGADVAFLAREGFAVEGIDASDDMLQQAIRHHPEINGKLRRVACPFDLITLTSNSFDGISAQSVLMHLDASQLNQTFTEFYRILAPKGVLYISLFDKRNDLNLDGRDQPGRKFHLYTEGDVRQRLSGAGFTVLESHPVGSDALGRSGVQLREYVAVKPNGEGRDWSEGIKLP